ncbi:MAG: alpha/beta hydrolase [Anaeromyxobacteraceae bacterium]
MPPLAFLPGAAGGGSFWAPVAERLGDRLPREPCRTDRLAGIQAPTLLLWSDADPISLPSVARFLADRIPDARIVIVPGGTHAFGRERPDEVAVAIRSHLEGA